MSGVRHRLSGLPRERALLEEPREAPVFQDTAAGLADRAVEDRVLFEVDAREGRAAARARFAELVVDAVDDRVALACDSQLEAACHLLADRVGEPHDLVIVDLARERVR